MLVWNAFVGDFNSGKIVTYNIFDHYSFLDDCKKAVKKCADDKEQFAEKIKNSLYYYYWSKCEWEVVITHWPSSKYTKDKKIDVCEQVLMNWDIFIDYLWAHKEEL